MPERPTLVPAVMMSAAMVLVGSSVALAFAELAPLYELSTSDQERFELFSGPTVALPVAATSRADQVQSCYRLSAGIYARAQPTDRRERLLRGCVSMGMDAVASTPTMGIAWAIAGALSGELNDNSAFNRDFLNAHRVAPTEQWQAEFRVALIEDHFSLADEDLKRAEQEDLALLIQSERGIRSIAARWVDVPDFRDRVTSVAETLSATDQRRFLSEVQHAASLSKQSDDD